MTQNKNLAINSFLLQNNISNVYAEKQSIILPVDTNLAKKLLATNIENNRDLSWSRIKQYAQDMKTGRWVINGETIKIDENGQLIDGQHRLHAVIESGNIVNMEFSFNISHSAITTIDTGKSRTGSDVLKMTGVENTTVINTALRGIITYEFGYDMGTSHTEITNLKIGSKNTKIITNDMVLNAYSRHPLISNFVPKKSEVKNFGNRALLTAIHYLFWLASPIKANAFMECFYHGYYIMDGTRKTLPKVSMLSKEVSAMYANRFSKRMSTKTIALMFIKVWNSMILDKDLKRLSITDKDKNLRILQPSKIPLIINSEFNYGS